MLCITLDIKAKYFRSTIETDKMPICNYVLKTKTAPDTVHILGHTAQT